MYKSRYFYSATFTCLKKLHICRLISSCVIALVKTFLFALIFPQLQYFTRTCCTTLIFHVVLQRDKRAASKGQRMAAALASSFLSPYTMVGRTCPNKDRPLQNFCFVLFDCLCVIFFSSYLCTDFVWFCFTVSAWYRCSQCRIWGNVKHIVLYRQDLDFCVL